MNFYTVKLAPDAAELSRLKEELQSVGLSWTERLDRKYDAADLRSAPLVRLIVRRKEEGYGGPTYGTTYDLAEACPTCGTGAIQTSPLRLDPTQIPESGAIFETLDGELLVSRAVARELGGLTGVELNQAETAGGGRMDWFQVIPLAHMPRMASSTKGLRRWKPCSTCDRDGYFEGTEPLEAAYRAHNLPEELHDFYSTWERFGKSVLRAPFHESSFANPLILVSARAQDILAAASKAVEFVPVTLEDSSE